MNTKKVVGLISGHFTFQKIVQELAPSMVDASRYSPHPPMGASLLFKFFSHDFAFLFQKDLTKSTMADRSLKEYPQWGQHIKSQLFERRHPEHFISPSTNSFPQRGHFKIDFILVPIQN